MVLRSSPVSDMAQRFYGQSHGWPEDVVSTEWPVVLSAWLFLGQQLSAASEAVLGYSYILSVAYRPLCLDAPEKALARGRARILTALKPDVVSFLFLLLPSLGGTSFLLGAGNKCYFFPLVIQDSAYTKKKKILLPLTSSANYTY